MALQPTSTPTSNEDPEKLTIENRRRRSRRIPPEELYKSELEELQKWGYVNEKLNLEKLVYYRGSVEAVVMEYKLTKTSVHEIESQQSLKDSMDTNPAAFSSKEEEEWTSREEELEWKIRDLELRFAELEAEHEEDIDNLVRDHEQDVRDVRTEMHLRIESLRTENQTMKAAHRQLTEENLSLKRKARDVSMANLSERRGREGRLQMELEHEKKVVEGMENKIERLELEKDGLLLKLRRSEKEQVSMKEETKRSTDQISSLKAQIAKQEKVMNELRARVNDLEGEVQELGDSLVMVEIERENQSNLVSELEKRNAESEELVQEYDAELVASGQELEACVDRIDSLEKELYELKSTRLHFLEWYDKNFVSTSNDSQSQEESNEMPIAESTSPWMQYRLRFVETESNDLMFLIDLAAHEKENEENESEHILSLTEVLSNWIGMNTADQNIFRRYLEEIEVFVAAKAGLRRDWDGDDGLFGLKEMYGGVSWMDDRWGAVLEKWKEKNEGNLENPKMRKLMFYAGCVFD